MTVANRCVIGNELNNTEINTQYGTSSAIVHSGYHIEFFGVTRVDAMPELPEVEHARRSLEKWFARRTLVRTEAEPKARTFRGASITEFEALTGRLEKASRKGKYLMLAFTGGRGLVGHLGMTGKFVKRPNGAAVKYSKARFVLDSGEVVHFTDPRLFGRMEPVPAEALTSNPVIAALGIDPVVDGLTWAQLKAAVGPSRQGLKVALMDQHRIAGLGNIHAAEALFRAKLHPARAPGSLDDAEWKALTKAIHASIDFALKAEAGDEIEYVEEPGAKNPFRIYGRAGARCFTCKTTVEQFTQAGRTTHFCPTCQPLKKRSRA